MVKKILAARRFHRPGWHRLGRLGPLDPRHRRGPQRDRLTSVARDGQPVTIGGIGASVFPRVTVDLEQVTIGQPPRIQVDTLHIATNFRALLSRRIEHGTVRLSKARIELPLPAFGSGPATKPEADAAAGAAIEIASIDDIELRDVELVSGTRTLRGNIDASIEGQGIVLRSIELAADDTSIAASGRITDMSAPAGELTIKAGSLNLDNLIAFASDFAGSAGVTPASQAGAHQPGRNRAAGSPGKMQIAVTLEAPRATMGGLTIDKLSGRATLGADSLVVDPVSFGLFGGRYEGRSRPISQEDWRSGGTPPSRTSTSPRPLLLRARPAS